MREAFIEKRFNRSSETIIEHASLIATEHATEGYVLTLRQLYYQLVYRKLIQNTPQEYKRISSIVNDARLAGALDWESIDDRTRFLRVVPFFSSGQDFISAQASQFAINLWEGQSRYCEVWIEKDSLSGTIERPCLHYRVPFFACRGYASQTGLYEAGRRLSRVLESGRVATIFHLGDHDEAGLDMSRDNEARVNVFARAVSGVKFVRLALNRNQIDHFDLPHDPNSNAAQTLTWELDAMPPREIEALVASSIEGVLDLPAFESCLKREKSMRQELLAIYQKKGAR